MLQAIFKGAEKPWRVSKFLSKQYLYWSFREKLWNDRKLYCKFHGNEWPSYVTCYGKIIKLVSGAFLSSNKGPLTQEYQKDKICAPFKIDSKCLAPPSISWPFLLRRVSKFSLVSEYFCPVSKFVLFLLVNNLPKIFVLIPPPPCQSLSWRSYSPIIIPYMYTKM
jgi:hypothetical protein